MHISGLRQALSLEAPVATVVAVSVLCGSALAQPLDVLPESGSIRPDADVPSKLMRAESLALRESGVTPDEVDRPASGGATQQRSPPFGAGSNGAPRLVRSDVEAAPWQSLPGQPAANDYRAEVSEISARWWFSVGRTDVGFGVGGITLMARPIVEAVTVDKAGMSIALASSPSLSLGIRRRTSAASTLYADATRTRSMGVSGIDSYSGKVGIEWKTAESRWSVAYSGLNMRLGSEARMTVSLRKGGLGIYMRSQF